MFLDSSSLRIALLSANNSIHTVRWANGLAQRGVDIHLISFNAQSQDIDPRVTQHRLPWGAPHGYWLAAQALKRLLNQIAPDLLNAHYATGYGLLARLSGFGPTLLSAWGSDIYAFPAKSRWHLGLLRRNLASATCLAATSHAMAQRMSELLDAPVIITPFGIDEELFAPPAPLPKDDDPDRPLIIGTVKSLEITYGIDSLLQAFTLLKRSLETTRPDIAHRLRLLIYGKGSQRENLERLAQALGISTETEFRGYIPHAQVPTALHEFDVYAALSRQDSFGVAILEASSTGLPVVVSDADGPAEVVVDGKTGYVVPREDAAAAADRLRRLILDPDERRRLGSAGRQRVVDLYSWRHSVDVMLQAYDLTINQYAAMTRP
ncbi:glycosyltransferase [Bordetella bronchiseptica]|uniref:glycosyltransferase n=1 Tax=Bordetella bronchiseptica TaxID=518 RepID=UPI00067B6DC3|nr:glycosyltransferase [Bordetella bronchiseptica]